MTRIEQPDGINRYRFHRQPEQLAAWLSARGIPRPAKGHAAPAEKNAAA